MDWRFWLAYYSPFVRIFEFGAGWICAVCFKKFKVGPRKIFNDIVALFSTFVIIFIFVSGLKGSFSGYALWASTNFLYAPFVAIIIFALITSKTSQISFFKLGSRLFSSKPFLEAGAISYSLYMLQHWTWGLMGPKPVDGLGTILFPLTWLFLLAVVATFLSKGAYEFFEKPCQKLLRRLFCI